MSETTYVDERLEQLGGSLSAQRSLVPDVMAEIRAINACVQPRNRKRRSVAWKRSIAVSVVGVVIAAVFWGARPQSLYAQTIAALEKVRTIHVTGQVSKIIRQWPLEGDAVSDPQKQYDVDLWYWSDGGPRAFERFGPVTATRDGEQLQEYQGDADLLYLDSRSSRDEVERLASLTSFLTALKAEGKKVSDLGGETLDGRRVRHVQFVRGSITDDYWFDAETKLPVRQVRSSDRDDTSFATYELNFHFNKDVPKAVAFYVPPKASQTRYGMRHDDARLAWLQHVEAVAESVSDEASRSPVVVPRDHTFGLQYPVNASGGTLRVVPLDIMEQTPLDLRHFVKLRAATTRGAWAMPLWRVDRGLDAVDDVVFPRSDVVFRAEAKRSDWVNAALASIGLELVNVQEDRTYWIARHDGRELRPYAEVKPPVGPQTYGGRVVKGLIKLGVGHRHRPVTLDELFVDFGRVQNIDLTGSGPIVIDETGLPTPPEYNDVTYGSWKTYQQAVDYDRYLVASDAPYFAGEQGRSMARDWFANEFGITFDIETRPTTVHVIKRID